MGRAAHFAPMWGGERTAYWVYQLSNIAILVRILFARVRTAPPLLFGGGLVLYGAGLVLLAAVGGRFRVAGGARREPERRLPLVPQSHVRRLFSVLPGCALLAQSPLLAALTLVFQFSAHWIILAEERWCIQQFGDTYVQYMKTVRRYL